jgi:hypothetical protein
MNVLAEMWPNKTTIRIPISDLPLYKNVKIEKDQDYMQLIFEDQAAACSHNLGWNTDNNLIPDNPPHHQALK